MKTGSGIKKGAQWTGRQAKKSDLVRGAINDAKKIGRGIKNIAGKLRATAKVPEDRKLLDVRRALNAKGLIPKRRTPYPGSRSGPTMTTGVVKDKTFHGISQKPIGRDRSVWGRPVYAPKKKIERSGKRNMRQIIRGARQPRPGRTVQGIARDNLKPGRKVTGTKRLQILPAQAARKPIAAASGSATRVFNNKTSRKMNADRGAKRKVENRRKRGKKRQGRGPPPVVASRIFRQRYIAAP